MRLPLELDITLEERVKQLKSLGVAICETMQEQVAKTGVTKVITIDFDCATFRMEKDPYSGQFSLEGKWLDRNNQTCGNIIFHADGTFFAEYDVIAEYPCKKRWFIEAITAWGRDDNIKTDLRLMENISA